MGLRGPRASAVPIRPMFVKIPGLRPGFVQHVLKKVSRGVPLPRQRHCVHPTPTENHATSLDSMRVSLRWCTLEFRISEICLACKIKGEPRYDRGQTNEPLQCFELFFVRPVFFVAKEVLVHELELQMCLVQLLRPTGDGVIFATLSTEEIALPSPRVAKPFRMRYAQQALGPLCLATRQRSCALQSSTWDNAHSPARQVECALRAAKRTQHRRISGSNADLVWPRHGQVCTALVHTERVLPNAIADDTRLQDAWSTREVAHDMLDSTHPNVRVSLLWFCVFSAAATPI